MPDLRERLAQIMADAEDPADATALRDLPWYEVAKWLRIADAILASEDWQAREAVVQAAIRWHPVEATQDVLTTCGLCAGLLRLARLDAGKGEG